MISYLRFFLFLLLALALQQCTLNDEPGGSHDPALTLQATANLSLITLNWTPVKITGFKEYVILQSAKEIPNAPEPPVDQDVAVLTRINDVNVTTFSTTNTLFTPKSCYKLYCSADDRFLYSGTVCVDQVVTRFAGFFDKIDHDTDLDQLGMFDRLTDNLMVYDYKANSFSNSLQETNLNFPIINISGIPGDRYLFAYDQSFNTVRKYTFPGLGFINQKTIGEAIIGGKATGSFLYMLTQSGSSGFQVLNVNTLSTVDSRLGLSGSRNLAVFEGDTITVLEIGDPNLIVYKLKSNGKILTSETINAGISQPGLQNTCDQNANYFIGGRFATIINRKGEIVQSLISGNNAFTLMSRFSPDGSKVLTIVNENNAVNLQIFDITSLPAIPQLKSFPLPNVTYSDLFVDEDIIYVAGVDFNTGSAQTFILQFPM
ncbi:MAG TPA: hypothetical protein VJ508_12625 [Saprospiraceae bacterium]|nr:hypothetical protein [Saprospiraceae bacterium]